MPLKPLAALQAHAGSQRLAVATAKRATQPETTRLEHSTATQARRPTDVPRPNGLRLAANHVPTRTGMPRPQIRNASLDHHAAITTAHQKSLARPILNLRRTNNGQQPEP